jgi:hypothetical protein
MAVIEVNGRFNVRAIFFAGTFWLIKPFSLYLSTAVHDR